jgi:hypothetical protein
MLDATTGTVVTAGTERLAHAPATHPPVRRARIGVLLANLGTPDNHDYWSMRRYLNEFLSDKRVIDYPDWKWQPLLQLFCCLALRWRNWFNLIWCWPIPARLHLQAWSAKTPSHRRQAPACPQLQLTPAQFP